jgi:hypothetical protein
LLLVALCVIPASAHGVEAVGLDWTAPEGCPDRAAVLQALERLSAAVPSGRVPVHAKGTIARDGEVWKLRLEVDSGDDSGVRELQDGSCVRLAQVAALSLALALETSVQAAQPAKVPRPPQETDLEPPRWLLRAFLAGDLGTLRAPSPGPGLAVGLFVGRTRLELSAAYWFAQTVAGLEYQLVAGGLQACHPVTDTPEIALCAGLEGGRMQARFVDIDAMVVHGWLGLLGGAALGWSFTPWLALRLEVGLGMTLVAPRLDPGDDGSRGPAPVFGRARLGVEVRFR